MGLFGKKQFTVWVTSEACWVVEKPRTDVEIKGIILPGASVFVKKAKKGWLEIIRGPVRNPENGEFIKDSGLFIQAKDVKRR